MEPSMHVERTIGTMIAMTGSTRSEETIPITCRKFYKERRQVIRDNVCLKDLHEKIKRGGFCTTFLSKVSLFRNTSEHRPT